MTTAIYSITVGNVSKNELLFGISILISVIFSAAFGVAVSGGIIKSGMISAEIALVLIFIVAGIERYDVHVRKKEPWWNFR